MSFICATRALKNAKHIQSIAPNIIPKDEPAEGFYSIVPFDVLGRLHLMSDEELAAHPHLVDAAKSLRSLQLQPRASLFKGTLHFVQITFNVNGTPTFVSDADMATLIQYGIASSGPISGYAAQYGSNTVNVSPTKLTFRANVPTGKFNDHDLQGWV